VWGGPLPGWPARGRAWGHEHYCPPGRHRDIALGLCCVGDNIALTQRLAQIPTGIKCVSAAEGGGGDVDGRTRLTLQTCFSRLTQCHCCVPFVAQVSAHEAATARKKVAARRADALLRACASGDAAAVQSTLDAGCPPDACDYDRRTGLMLAAANGHRDVVSLLLSAGSNPNARDNLGGSALLEAVRGGWDGLIQLLTEAGAHLQLSAAELASALCEMVKEDQQHLLRRYITAGKVGLGGVHLLWCGQGGVECKMDPHFALGRGERGAGVHFWVGPGVW
jgi:hypothetical protein